ncbi:polyprenol phosphomannose-dependent alpha 1,6 mannosyltransferase MptB [Streptomyces sp. 8L]|uniref:polyprenol phosphomannose-dependent alpha 1,6 mannosyltransferase MptB n=1 Tax=Streptomyces sp. 8L TaxID=2877242 RepID=UPI001CD1F4FA|nr:polyprenol phosphomannose-dependent alpha 1,6 mannosyltransferase MptB [Streptomyces sp. 8L]MCA1217448.1 polyprenol phosphomannose-dependent alpha 1,6 mannosyltransferase MptB [Streptomyces sp. 8L]
MLALNVDLDPGRCRTLGFVGSLALTAGGLTAGALPVRDALPPSSGRFALGVLTVYFGLVLLVAAWWWLGTALRGPRPPTPRDLVLTLAVWSAPLLCAPPLFSRDVYSYLAQGAMVDAGIDVYHHGPADLGGPSAAGVAPVWAHTPAPYGPVFLAVAGRVARTAGPHVAAGVLGMRGVALLGVGLLVALLPVIARHCGVEPAGALWLGALNPLVLLHLVSGAHNDALMLGLLGAGLVAALARRPAAATVLVTLAGLVKAPALLGLGAVAALWAPGLTGRARTVRAVAMTAVLALATTALATALARTGYGWLGSLATPVSSGNWSLTSGLGRITAAALAPLPGGEGLARLSIPLWRGLGLAGTAALALAAWLRRDRLGAVHALALSLLAVFLLGPALRPWYALWGLVLVGASAPAGRLRTGAAALGGALAFVLMPDGLPPGGLQLALAVCGGVLAVLALWWMLLLAPAASSVATSRPRTAL